MADVLHKLKVESANGKEKFLLGEVAQIKLNNSMFVVDLSSLPEVGKICTGVTSTLFFSSTNGQCLETFL